MIGADANGEALREFSHKALRKAAKGGLKNVCFLELALKALPNSGLYGFFDSLSVILPWGTLLEAVAAPERGELKPLLSVVKPGGTVELLFGYSAATDPKVELPPLTPERLRALPALFGELKKLRVESVSQAELRQVPSTWAGKLAFGKELRPFVRVHGRLPL